ncbi:WDR25 [Cervus elaphus hippelaphus]|uniref:WDR25 n=1 Tax=Cervus elaphus hippelaphus TaxID=46360 RepID=A0A212CS89_CEREH|nr:WDR25 [Cervus elaphus hippelaphus]
MLGLLVLVGVVRSYKATIQQTLDILFLREGSEFLSSTDASSRDSADRTIIAWDFQSSAKISNQIFHERYTCPSLTLHPREPVFLAQTNGNYLALFSAVWPYRMSRRRRYEGHKVPRLVASPRGWGVVPRPRRQGPCSLQEQGPSVRATCAFCFLGDPIPCDLMPAQGPGPHLALPWAPAAGQGWSP